MVRPDAMRGHGPEDMPAVHEQHRLNTAAHVAQLAADAVKTARLQSIGSVPPLAEQP
jgi:hypothetical protein